MNTPPPTVRPPTTTPRPPPPPPPPPPVTTLTFVPPRTGGGSNENEAWTGGTTLKPILQPGSVLAFRPSNFRDRFKIEEKVTVGLPPSYQLHLEAGEKDKCTLSKFVTEFKDTVTRRGCEGVFVIYDADTNTELDIFDNFGSVTTSMVEDWVKSLRNGVRIPDGSGGFTNLPPCPYDAQALDYSGTMLKASLAPTLWNQVQLQVGSSPNGVTLFIESILAIQDDSASSNRKLVSSLQALKLVDEPGQNVLTFLPKIIDLANRISRSRNCPGDLDALIIKCFMGCSCEAFRLRVLTHYNLAEGHGGIGWEKFLKEMQSAYNKDFGLEMWPAAAKSKAESTAQREEGALKGLTAAVNALQQKVDSVTKGSGGTTPGGASAPATPTRREPPRDRDPTGFRKIPPADGEPLVKVVEGKTYTWCHVCGWWTVGSGMHSGPEHRTKSEIAAAKATKPATPSNGAGKLAAFTPTVDKAVTFASDTTGGVKIASATNEFPTKSRLQMIGGMFMASVGSTSTPAGSPSPPPPPTTDDLHIETDSVHTLGVCPICGEEGPEGDPCTECEDPDCIYEVHYYGPCVICGEYGPTGYHCTDCNSDAGGVYDSAPKPSPPSPPEDLTRLLERLPASLIAAAATSTAPVEPIQEILLGHDDTPKIEETGDEDDDSSFVSAVSRVSSASETRVRLAGPLAGVPPSPSTKHLNFFAGQDSS